MAIDERRRLLNPIGGMRELFRDVPGSGPVDEFSQYWQGLLANERAIYQLPPTTGLPMNQPPPVVDYSGASGMVSQDALQAGIGGAYNLVPGTEGYQGLVTEPDFMERLGSLSGDDIMGGLQGIKGLLDAVYPEQTPLVPQKIPSASAGLSLSTNPYEDLYKRYGLLGR